MLPAEEEPDEVRCRDGLNFAAQPSNGQSMNARQYTAIAPFDFDRFTSGTEPAAENLSFRFEAGEAGINQLAAERKPFGEFGRGDGSARFEPAAQNFGDGRLLFVARSRMSGMRHAGPLSSGPKG